MAAVPVVGIERAEEEARLRLAAVMVVILVNVCGDEMSTLPAVGADFLLLRRPEMSESLPCRRRRNSNLVRKDSSQLSGFLIGHVIDDEQTLCRFTQLCHC